MAVTDERIIIDITGDQLNGTWKSVYVGMETGNYEKLSRFTTQDNYDIRKQSQLWSDYNLILKYLKKKHKTLGADPMKKNNLSKEIIKNRGVIRL
ncbi:MAG: hypothetical protein SOR79_06010 [Blautia sp.]|uniref:hypothetical protein n=1 Tax=Blautia sp. TaxID=1955243 RepID=UPI002A7547A1|nr:hypothetical protein [Blautia sp.]MDY3016688.1 hypothetical protein [Blautia sp.]